MLGQASQLAREAKGEGWVPPGAAALGPRVLAVTGGELGQNHGADEDLGAAFEERGCHFHMLFQAQKSGLNPIVSCSGHGKKIKERGGKMQRVQAAWSVRPRFAKSNHSLVSSSRFYSFYYFLGELAKRKEEFGKAKQCNVLFHEASRMIVPLK